MLNFLMNYGNPSNLTIAIALTEATAGHLLAVPTLESGDVKISKDGGAFANMTILPESTGNYQVKVYLTPTEMTCGYAMIVFHDVSGAEWNNEAIIIQTINHASAHLPIVRSNMVQIDAQATNGNNATLKLKQLDITTSDGNDAVIFSAGSVIGSENGHGLRILSRNDPAIDINSAHDIGVKIRASDSIGLDLDSAKILNPNGIALDIQSTHSSDGDGAGIYIRANNGNNAGVVVGGAGIAAGMTITGGDTNGKGLQLLGHGDGEGCTIEGNGDGVGLSLQGGFGGLGLKIIGGENAGGAQIIGGTPGIGSGHGGDGLNITGTGDNGAHHGVYIKGNALGGHGATILGGGCGVSAYGTEPGAGGVHIEAAGGAYQPIHGMRIVGGGIAGAGLKLDGGPDGGKDIDASEINDLLTNLGIVDSLVDSIVAKLPDGIISDMSWADTIDGVSFSTITELVMSMVNGRFKTNTPVAGKITFYKRDNITPLFTCTITDTERTRD